MLPKERLTVDYRRYTKPDRLPTGRLLEADNVQMHVVEGSKNFRDTIIVPRAFKAYSGGGFEQQRDRVLAEVLKARVVGIDLPGLGMNKNSNSNDIWRREAEEGSLATRADLMLGALVRALDLPKEQELHFFGYSMGAWATAALLESLAFQDYQLRTGSVHLIEPVNDQDWKDHKSLGKVLLGEVRKGRRYYNETEELGFPKVPHAVLPENSTEMRPESKVSIRELYITSKGMRKGFAANLAKAVANGKSTGLDTAPIAFYRANGSLATRPDAIQASIDTLGQAGNPNVTVVEFAPHEDADPHRHLFWHSMGAVAMLASAMQPFAK